MHTIHHHGRALRRGARLLPLACLLLAARSASGAALLDPPAFHSQHGVLDLLLIAQPQTVTAFSGVAPTGWVYTACARPGAALECPPGAGTVSPYGGIRLALEPGDELKIRLVNKLPAMPVETVERASDNPLLPLNPTNLHTHGLIVEPTPNRAAAGAIPAYGDFVFTSVFNPANGDPAVYNPDAYAMMRRMHGDVVSGGAVDYDIHIPANHPSGAFWFHPHMHGISLNQLSAGLSGVISVGHVGSYACADARCAKALSESAVRYFVLKDMQVLGDGTPLLQEDPAFCANQTASTPLENGRCTADPDAYPGGKWFFTLNGQQYPEVAIGSPDGELWRFTNASGSASYDLQLLDDTTHRPIPLQIVSIDGVAVSFPAGVPSSKLLEIGGNRIRLADCGALNQSYTSRPVCASDLVMMPATRVEVLAAYRNRRSQIASAPVGQTATLRTAGINTGPGGDPWPAVNLAHVTFASGRPSEDFEALHVAQHTDIFDAPVPGVVAAPLPDGCRALPAGHRRRLYFGNPNVPDGDGPGADADGAPIFGIGYEEVDADGNAVPGTFVDVAQFDPTQRICLPLAPGQRPALETWELINLANELHNFHMHQTKFRVIASTDSTGVGRTGLVADTVPLPIAVPGPGSQPDRDDRSTSCLVADYKAGRCQVTPVRVEIPFAQVGDFVFHCHILEHEDGGMMHAIRVLPSPTATDPAAAKTAARRALLAR